MLFRSDGLADEEELALRMLQLSVVFVRKEMHGVFDEALLEDVGGELLSVLELVTFFVLDFFFVVPNEVIEIDDHQGVGLVAGFGDQIVVFYFKIGTTGDELGDSVANRLDPHRDLPIIRSSNLASIDCSLFDHGTFLSLSGLTVLIDLKIKIINDILIFCFIEQMLVRWSGLRINLRELKVILII